MKSDTGILLLIPGFGGNSQSNVYKKMRNQFADKHNLVVVQCDYFGDCFMQSSNKLNIKFTAEEYRDILSENDYKIISKSTNMELIIKTLSNYVCAVSASEVMEETKDLFNDMGIMQAIDLLTAIYAVKSILKDNDLIYNHDKVIVYGHSHGAFLGYLINRLAPHLFSLIIDNSAWLKPIYIENTRFLNQQYGKKTLQTNFDYYAITYNYDKEILDLNINLRLSLFKEQKII